MKVYRALVMIASLAGPSFAHAQMPSMNLIPELSSKSPEEKQADEARQQAYRDSLRKIPEAKASSDPWGAVRSVDAPKPALPTKPRTKTGSTAN